jgi:hypothetical protein
MDKRTVVVPRRRRPAVPAAEPLRIESMAAERGMAPVDLLADVLSRHWSLSAAAAELGVSLPTLAKYRKRFNIEIVEGD